MSRVKHEREKAHMCGLAAVRTQYPRHPDAFRGPTRIAWEFHVQSLRDPLSLAGALKAYTDGLCQQILVLGDGPGTPYIWDQPTQIRVRTKEERGVLVTLTELS